MAATIIHFGVDLATRVPVLKGAGFQVDVCSSIDSLIEALEAKHVDAVLVPSAVNVDSIVSVTRSRPLTPVILFAEVPVQPYDANFDLVVPVSTPPENWLADIAQLIAKRAVRANSQSLHAQAATLREESRAVRQRVTEQRELSTELRQHFSRKMGRQEAWRQLVMCASDEELRALREANYLGLRHDDDEYWRVTAVEDELRRRSIGD